MLRSIQWRIAILYVLLILISMGISGFYLVDLVKEERIDDLRSQLESEARIIAEAILPLWQSSSAEGIEDLTWRLGRQSGARITIIRVDGIVLGDSEEDPVLMENHADRPEVQEALLTGFGESRRYSTTLDRRMMYVAVPIKTDDSVLGVVRVALPTTEVDRMVGGLQRNVALSMGLTAAFAILGALYIARSTTRPIKEVTRAAKRIASGEFDQPIFLRTGDESAELASAFNEMAHNLRRMIGDLSTERNKLAAVLDTMADGVIMTDVEGDIVMTNPAAERLLKFSGESATGRHLIEVVQDHEINEVFRAYIRTGQPQARQVEQTSRGRLLRVIVSGISYHDAVGALLIFQDLTEVRRLQTVRQQFVGNISHELRTPLASIKAVVETLEEGVVDDPRTARDFLGKIDIEVDRMAQLVRELAELSRIETGQIELKLAPIDLKGIIDQVMEELHHQAERKGVSMRKNVEPPLPLVNAEAERILQVLRNLIHNAIKFTPEGGRVEVSARAENGKVILSVIDTGAGIPPQDLPHVFERFYKADRARSSEGTGLGLAIAKHLIKAHGGEIWAESEVDHGSIFSFSLPVAS